MIPLGFPAPARARNGPATPPPCCPVCADPLGKLPLKQCRRCEARHHAACWDYQRGCGTYGCGSRSGWSVPAQRPRAAPGRPQSLEVERGLEREERPMEPVLAMLLGIALGIFLIWALASLVLATAAFMAAVVVGVGGEILLANARVQVHVDARHRRVVFRGRGPMAPGSWTRGFEEFRRVSLEPLELRETGRLQWVARLEPREAPPTECLLRLPWNHRAQALATAEEVARLMDLPLEVYRY